MYDVAYSLTGELQGSEGCSKRQAAFEMLVIVSTPDGPLSVATPDFPQEDARIWVEACAWSECVNVQDDLDRRPA